MTRRRFARSPLVLLVILVGCSGGATPPPSPSPSTARISEAAAKLELLDRFGPLIYCDPDEYPVAREDPNAAALAHVAEMQGDPVWPMLAARLGFSATVAPSGDTLLAAYRTWKMVRALGLTSSSGGWAFEATFGGTGADAGQADKLTHVAGTIDVNGGVQITTKEAGGYPPCPICLARGTAIATPVGDVAVEALRPGDPVWTLDLRGERIAGVVVGIGSMAVATGHQVVRLILGDGRTVQVSPGHPLPDGRPVGALTAGARYDGSLVVSAQRIAYDGGRTFDLLPSGATGVYWANGIELGSTLFR
jgi:Hint domain-containing protein